MKFEFLFRLDYNLFLSEFKEFLSVYTAKKNSKFLKFEFGIQKSQKSYINVWEARYLAKNYKYIISKKH